jgi:hypothetical protein
MAVRGRSPLRRAKIVSKSGNQCSVTFDGGIVLTNVPIIGNAGFLHIGGSATVLCVDNWPVVFALSNTGDDTPAEDSEEDLPGTAGNHGPVKLNSVATSNVFKIPLQKLQFRVQNPHKFLAGSLGDVTDIEPYFRTIVLGDLPDIDLADLANVDETAPNNGDVLKYASSTSSWGPAAGGAVTNLDDLADVDATTPSDGDTLAYNATSETWVAGAASGGGVRQSILTFVGTLAIGANPLRVYNRLGSAQTISEVYLAVGTAPAGAAIQVDVKCDGVSIFGTRPEISAGNHTGSSTTFGDATWAAGSYLTAHVTAIGQTLAGSDLVVHIVHS